jgi:hypothetical protein
VNGLGGRSKPSIPGIWWFTVTFGLLKIIYLSGSKPAEPGGEKALDIRRNQA